MHMLSLFLRLFHLLSPVLYSSPAPCPEGTHRALPQELEVAGGMPESSIEQPHAMVAQVVLL
jgi:hypothetical protein